MVCMSRIALLSLLALVAGCVSAPLSQQADGADGGRGALSVCRGLSVANAPRTDNAGHVQGFTATTTVRGARLLRKPVEGCLSSAFGPRRGGAGRMHEGLDISTRTPRPILAAGGGRVIAIKRSSGYGLTVTLDHRNGVATRYAHLSRAAENLRAGDRVKSGTVIGWTGKSGNATGVHLHYEILVDGRPINPLQ